MQLIKKSLFFGLLVTVITVQAATKKSYEFVSIKGVTDQAVAVKLMTHAYEKVGLGLKATPMAGSRALEEASSGRADGETMRVYAVGERFPSLIRVPTPIMSLETVGYGIKNPKIVVEKPEDLYRYSVMRIRGVQHTQNLSNELQLRDTHILPSAKLFGEFLSRGRADIGLTSRLNGKAYVKASGVTNVEVVTAPLKELLLYHYVHEKNKEIVPIIDKVIKEMVESGEWAKLLRKYEEEVLSEIKSDNS